MYGDPTISFIQLMVAADKAETEVIDSKGSVTTSKAGVINDTTQSEIQVLSKQIANLLAMVNG